MYWYFFTFLTEKCNKLSTISHIIRLYPYCHNGVICICKSKDAPFMRVKVICLKIIFLLFCMVLIYFSNKMIIFLHTKQVLLQYITGIGFKRAAYWATHFFLTFSFFPVFSIIIEWGDKIYEICYVLEILKIFRGIIPHKYHSMIVNTSNLPFKGSLPFKGWVLYVNCSITTSSIAFT